MKTTIVCFALFAVAFAASANDPIPIISQEADVGFDGTFRHAYESGNGIVVQEQGVLKNAGNKDTEAQEVQGTFKFTAPDGQTFTVTYVANENGFQPEGAHFPVAPTPPPIPAAILRALEWNEKHPEEEDKSARRL